VTHDKFQIVGESLTGRGLSFDIAQLGASDDQAKRLVEIAEAIFLQGRASALLSYDDRFDLHNAAEVLRALSVVIGPNPTGDRNRQAADIIVQLLQDQKNPT
jgi:hypothetical protein